MNTFLPATILALFLLFGSDLTAQPRAHYTGIGVRIGKGTSLAPHPTVSINGDQTALRASSVTILGATVQYLLGNKFGGETGILLHYSTMADARSSWMVYRTFKRRSRGGYGNLYNYKVPLLFVYHIQVKRRWSLKLLAGPSLNYTFHHVHHNFNYGEVEKRRLFSVSNTIEVRIATRERKYGKIECGLQYQFPIKKEYITFQYYPSNTYRLDFSTRLLAVNLTYFWYNKNGE